MSCPLGFDPFGERDEDLLEHASTCASCGDVLHVLATSRKAWRQGLANDEARAVFRERRLGRARPPARVAVTSFAFVFAVAALSGYALARRGEAHREDAPREAATSQALVEPPAVAPHRAPPRAVASANPSEDPAPDPVDADGARVRDPIESARPEAPPPAPTEGPRELWQRAVTLLEAGDRAGAEHAFRRVMESPSGEGGLRARATFRWAQLLLARGDTRTPRDALHRLVRGRDTALGFDAAMLLERCAPEERAAIWDAYFEGTTDPGLRERAMRHRDGG